MIPEFIIDLMTFPGVMVHGLARRLVCDWTGTKVWEVCYFRIGTPSGFVIHDAPATVWGHLLIDASPLLFNSLIGGLIGLLAVPLKHVDGLLGNSVLVLVLWLAVSIAMHAFPEARAAQAIWAAIGRRDAPLSARLLGTPLVGLLYVGVWGSFFRFDFFYGVGVVLGLQYLLRLL